MELVRQELPGGSRVTGWLHPLCADAPAFDARPAVLVIPGGAYEHIGFAEGEPVALQFFAAGYQAFLLDYAVAPRARDWQPMIDAARAVDWLHRQAAALHIRPGQVAVCGFSAGGHLAACSAILWDAVPVQEALGQPGPACRPDAVILSYPVITAGRYRHEGSIRNIAGEDPALWERFSLEKQVRPGLPPFFVWHTVADGVVPVENALLLAGALRKSSVPFELHLFPEGDHGMSLCTAALGTEMPHNARWFGLCLDWLSGVFGFRA